MNPRAEQWPEKDPAERFPVRFDFASELEAGETIDSATVAVLLRAGADASPSAVLNGAHTLGGGHVDQPIKSGVHAASYGLRCEATTSLGKVLVRAALLPVRDAV